MKDKGKQMAWQKDDEVLTTFGSLKQAQNEAFQEGIAFAINKLRNYQEQEIADILEVDLKDATLYEVGE
jgi:hypothetical protein